MTLEQALKKIDAYTPRERATHEKVHSAYRRVRDRLRDSAAYITREMVRVEYGGNSTGTVSKYLPPIEAIEGAKDKDSSPSASSATASPKTVPEPLQKVLDSARVGLDAIGPAIVEAMDAREAELTVSYQRVVDQQKTIFADQLATVQARNADLEPASIEAGAEAEELQLQLDEIRARLETVSTERADARAQAERLATANELLTTRLSAAEAQIATHRRTEEHVSEELDRLLAERDLLVRDAEQGREARSEVDQLRRRLGDVEFQKHELTTELRAARDREEAAHQKHEQHSSELQERIAALAAQLTRLVESVGVPMEGK